ncbi:unnamed protein product [Linum tenue]|uniref:Disease resistance RPP13-like protein 1 n=1 Tax=Linum tenue TaxID=586396 RepID=A0AAV0NSX5_9ROSI|nr:unnamed protein product [Linum tenue]
MMVGGSILGAFLQVLFDRIASREVLDFFRGQKLSVGLLQKLNTMLIYVSGVLDDAEEKQITKPSVKLWLDELKDAVYVADDLLDEVAYESLRSELESHHSSISVHQPFKIELEAQLREILERLEYLLNQRDGLGLREGGFVRENPSSSKLPSTSLVDEFGGVYGRDADREAIMELLLENGNGVGVIPIVGMGGVGKTTLAQLVYNDRRVEDCFNVKAWVCVSQEPSISKITKDILEEVTGGTFDGNFNQLQLELKGRLKGKKFLIVLDDVWNDKYADWDVLRRPLMTGVPGSVVLVTTRNESVASIMQTVPIYNLKGLSCDDSCYHYLPSHLKRCFAYCAIFPKDYDFEKDELVYLWMAEGFIEQQSRGNKLMEELGDEYFNDLVSRSFFQRSSVDPTGYVMHDLINDLAKYVSSEFCFRLDCEDSCKINGRIRHLSYAITECNLAQKLESIHEAGFLRTFWLFDWSSYFVTDATFNLLLTRKRLRVLSLSHLRTLTELPDSIGHLKHLRYLNLSATAIQYLPATLCGVYNMQTLILHQCRELVQLPNNLGRLINLRHLDVRETNLQVMPLQMDKLTKLHVLTDFIIGRGNGSCIKMLGGLQHLGGQLNVWKLQHVMEAQDALEANLKVKKYLKQLNFMWDGDTHDSVHERTVLEQLQPHTNIQSLSIVGYRGTRFPDWVGNSAFSSIVALKLSGGQHCNTLPPLGQLVSLSDLSIAAYVSVETSMLSWCEWIPFDGEAFPVLEKLYFRHCPNLKKALPSHLPSLSLLEVEGCQQLGVSLPRAPNICKIKFKDDTRDVQLVKLPSERHTLMIDRFNSVDTLLEAMEQMGGFSSTMERIEIRNCSSLRSFPLELFPGLKALILTRCLNLETLSASEVTGSNFPCLTCLEIRECPKLFSSLQETMPAPNLTRLLLMGCLGVESFPGKRLLPSTLTILKIWDFPSLTSLDWEGLQNLHSLRELQICNCPNLKCLPEEGFPLNLSHLYVSWCPLLEQRCRPDDGEDWPKIAHIPELEINFQKITTLEPSA